jgi:sentrin-specific protease 8
VLLQAEHLTVSDLKKGHLVGRFEGVTHIFLPLGEGKHWSLLVFSVLDHVVFHYDSMAGYHDKLARTVTNKMAGYLGEEMQLVKLKDTPQQDDGSSCGMYVIWFIKHLLVRRLLRVEKNQEVDMSLGGKNVDPQRMRRELLRIVENLRKKAARTFVSPTPHTTTGCR